MHYAVGIMVLVIAVELIGIAIILSPVLSRLKLNRNARRAFAALMVSLGGYLAWIAHLFFEDNLNDENYTPELIFIRFIALVSATWFLAAAIRCHWRGRWRD
jgi:hypothetical protein